MDFLHDEKPIYLSELRELLKRVYTVIDKVDERLQSNQVRETYKSIFLGDSMTLSRKAVSILYDRLGDLLKVEKSDKSIGKFMLFNLPTERMINNIESYEKIAEAFCNNSDDVVVPDYWSMRNIFLSKLYAELFFLTQTLFEKAVQYEINLLNKLPKDEKLNLINYQIPKIENEKVKCKDDIFLNWYYEARLGSFKDFLGRNSMGWSIPIANEKLLRTIVDGLQRLQGLSKAIDKKEKSRTQLLAAFIREYIIKDESGFGVSESGISMGEVDIKLEDSLGNLVCLCEAMNLESPTEKNKILTHIEKIFNYDLSGLKCNFVICFVNNQDIIKTSNNLFKYVKANTFKKASLISIERTDDSRIPNNFTCFTSKFIQNDSETTIYSIILEMKFPISKETDHE
jgi:hypothetical protein